jgi:hypothetical protein
VRSNDLAAIVPVHLPIDTHTHRRERERAGRQW